MITFLGPRSVYTYLGGGAKAFKMHFLEIGIWKCDYGKKCPLTWDIFMVHDVNNPSSGSFS